MLRGDSCCKTIVSFASRPVQLASLALVAISTVLAAPVQAKVSLTFGAYTADKPTAVVRQFRPLLDELEKLVAARIGEPVEIQMKVAASYERGLKDLVDGTVDFVRFGPASYIFAKREAPGLSVLAMESNKGKKRFNGVVSVHRDSEIQEVAELRGRSFAFGDESSTIGRYLSQLHLMQHGIMASDLGSYDYLGRHDIVGTSVGLGRFDAGALKESTFKKLVKKGTPIRAIATFENVTKPWIARAGLSPSLADAMRAALLELSEPKALEALGKDGFLEGDDSDYQVIREAITQNPRFFGRPSLTSVE